MDPQTLELLRCLQSGPYDESAWKRLREMLRTQRRVLRAQQDSSTLTDLMHLLDTWAEACDNHRVGADVLREAADVAERDLSQPAIAADLRKRAVTLGKLESRGASSPQATGKRRKDPRELNDAIETYERALEADADMETVYHLAELYSQRGDPGDAQQAADLYCTLGDLLGNPAGLPMLHRALEHVPSHTEARDLLAQYQAAQPSGARPRLSQPVAARPEPAVEELGPPPTIHSAPNAASLRARTQSKPTRTNANVQARMGNIDPRPRVATPAYSGAPAPIDQRAPRMAAPAPAGSGDSKKTAPGIAPAIVQSNLASGGKTYGTRATEPRQGNAAHAIAAEAIEPEPAAAAPMPSGQAPLPLRVATRGEPSVTPAATLSTKAPPPLRAAERRAAGQLPGPHAAPVITIVQSASIAPASASAPHATSITPSGASFSPSGTNEPPTSLSPVVTDDDALERSRARLSAMRARKRKVAAGALAAVAVAALAVLVIAPRSMEDAQRIARSMFGDDGASSTSASTTASASRPDIDPAQHMAAEKHTAEETAPSAREGAAPPVTETPGIPTSAATPDPAAEPGAAKSGSGEAATATPTETPAQPSTESKKTAPTGPVVRPLVELANQRGGKLTDPQLMAALEKAAPKLEQCYVQALEKKPRLKGRLIVAWTVRPNGKVAGAKKQGGTIKDADLVRCTVDVISGTRFPKPKKQAVQIRLPLDYRKS